MGRRLTEDVKRYRESAENAYRTYRLQVIEAEKFKEGVKTVKYDDIDFFINISNIAGGLYEAAVLDAYNNQNPETRQKYNKTAERARKILSVNPGDFEKEVQFKSKSQPGQYYVLNEENVAALQDYSWVLYDSYKKKAEKSVNKVFDDIQKGFDNRTTTTTLKTTREDDPVDNVITVINKVTGKEQRYSLEVKAVATFEGSSNFSYWTAKDQTVWGDGTFYKYLMESKDKDNRIKEVKYSQSADSFVAITLQRFLNQVRAPLESLRILLSKSNSNFMRDNNIPLENMYLTRSGGPKQEETTVNLGKVYKSLVAKAKKDTRWIRKQAFTEAGNQKEWSLQYGDNAYASLEIDSDLDNISFHVYLFQRLLNLSQL